MSEQDKEMEAAAAEYVGNDHSVAYDAFKAGWKAAGERKDAYKDTTIKRLTRALEGHRLTRNEYMDEIQSLQSKLAAALAALEWYANDGHTGRPILAGNVAREAIARIKGD